eukprot:scaffold154984_cov31-Tisochrysis_lutea.AAC.3
MFVRVRPSESNCCEHTWRELRIARALSCSGVGSNDTSAHGLKSALSTSAGVLSELFAIGRRDAAKAARTFKF